MKRKLVLSIINLLIFINSMTAQVWQGKNASFPSSMFGDKIYAVSDSVAWTLGLGNVVSGVGYTQSCISKTVDKGHSWYNIIYPQPGLTYATSIWALDQDTVWTTITYYPNGSGGPVENQLFSSVDGGLNWTKIPNPVNGYINFVYFWNSKEGIIVGDPVQYEFEVFKTFDGGETWNKILVIPASEDDEYIWYDNYDVSGDVIFFSSTLGRIFYSPSRGDYWNVLEKCPEQDFTVDWFSASDAGDYLIACNYYDPGGLVYQSRLWKWEADSSKWTTVWFDDNTYINDVSYIPGTDFIILALNEEYTFRTMISYDQGQHWLTIDTSAKVNRISFFNNETGYGSQVNYSWDQSKTLVYRYVGSPITGLFKNQLLPNVRLSLFPNPATDLIELSLSSTSFVDYCILINNSTGQLLEKRSIDQTTHTRELFDVAHYPPGQYYLTITNTTGHKIIPFIKH